MFGPLMTSSRVRVVECQRLRDGAVAEQRMAAPLDRDVRLFAQLGRDALASRAQLRLRGEQIEPREHFDVGVDLRAA